LPGQNSLNDETKTLKILGLSDQGWRFAAKRRRS